MITFTKLADCNHQHFAQSLFEEAFPEEERPPFSRIRQRDAGKFHFLVAENGDEPIGILSYWSFPELIYIEHFAIAEELRNQGLGKAVFLNFLSQQTEQVVLEVEKPVNEAAEHRIEFYASMGLFQNPQPYVQPSYHGDNRTVDMIIMSKYELDDDEFAEVAATLYSEVYGVSFQK
ncbi:MAG: GNAT family N-acetyltransferase [Bacteroidales bacterium]|nr:GNAT family N-acetyltransferase [Bacteroidales bacterium]